MLFVHYWLSLNFIINRLKQSYHRCRILSAVLDFHDSWHMKERMLVKIQISIHVLSKIVTFIEVTQFIIYCWILVISQQCSIYTMCKAEPCRAICLLFSSCKVFQSLKMFFIFTQYLFRHGAPSSCCCL